TQPRSRRGGQPVRCLPHFSRVKTRFVFDLRFSRVSRKGHHGRNAFYFQSRSNFPSWTSRVRSPSLAFRINSLEPLAFSTLLRLLLFLPIRLGEPRLEGVNGPSTPRITGS